MPFAIAFKSRLNKNERRKAKLFLLTVIRLTAPSLAQGFYFVITTRDSAQKCALIAVQIGILSHFLKAFNMILHIFGGWSGLYLGKHCLAVVFKKNVNFKGYLIGFIRNNVF
jgi:hypothetical protein